MSGITLRPVCPDDEDFLYQLYCSTRLQEVAAWGWNPSQQEVFLRMQFKAQHLHYEAQFVNVRHSIIEKDGKSIGRLFVDQGPKEFVLVDISLLPEHRGVGIGRYLIGRLQAEAARMNRMVRLHVLRGNPALHLYERLGFVCVGDDGVYSEMIWTPVEKPTSDIGGAK
ncbi:MAG: GNAT family N-acetyltransferase [Acidobacteriia bacterium]|nr:GNAT family N-acetyltransferase [Terriglobia bacterium]